MRSVREDFRQRHRAMSMLDRLNCGQESREEQNEILKCMENVYTIMQTLILAMSISLRPPVKRSGAGRVF